VASRKEASVAAAVAALKKAATTKAMAVDTIVTVAVIITIIKPTIQTDFRVHPTDGLFLFL
jgi:hypothetical protein